MKQEKNWATIFCLEKTVIGVQRRIKNAPSQMFDRESEARYVPESLRTNELFYKHHWFWNHQLVPKKNTELIRLQKKNFQ